jgi:hypothetical protein
MRSRDAADQLNAAAGRVAAIIYPFTVIVWDDATGAVVRDFGDVGAMRLPFAFRRSDGTITTIAREEDGLAYVLDLATGGKKVVPGPGLTTTAIVGRESMLKDATFDASGTKLARLIRGVAKPELCRIEIWDIATGGPIDQLDCSNVSDIVMDPAGHRLAWIEPGEPSFVRMWDIDQRRRLWGNVLPSPRSTYVGTHLAFSGDGQRLIVGGKTRATVLLAESGALVGPGLSVSAGTIHGALDAAGGRAAVATGDRTVVVWDVASGTPLRTVPFASDTLGNGGLAFSDDGRRVIAAFGDDNVNNPRIWQWIADPDALSAVLAERLAPILAAGR